jgi:hypothetical protein
MNTDFEQVRVSSPLSASLVSKSPLSKPNGSQALQLGSLFKRNVTQDTISTQHVLFREWGHFCVNNLQVSNIVCYSAYEYSNVMMEVMYFILSCLILFLGNE